MVEVIRSDGHLPANNVEGMGSVPSPLGQGLRQGSTGKPLRDQMNNGLKTRSMDLTLSFLSYEGVPHQDSAGATPTEI